MRALAAVLSVALVLAACGSDDDSSGTETGAPATETDGPATETDASATETDASATDGDVDVNVWIAFTDNRLDWTQDVADRFNEEIDGYNIVIQGYADYESLFDATLLAVDQGTPPAVVQYFEAATTDAQDAVNSSNEPIFTSVETAIAGREEILGVPVVLDDVVESARNYYTLDGEFKSMPWNTSSATLFVNRTLLDAAGVEGTPATWDELEAACEQFLASSAATDNCVTWPNHSWFIEQSIAQQGATLVDNDNGRSGRATDIDLTSDAMVDYLEWWAGLEDDGIYVYTGTQRDWGGTYDLFAAQALPFLIYSSSDTTLLTDEGKNGGFEVESAFMPRNGDRLDSGGNIIGGATLWLVDGLDEGEQDAALAFLNYLNSPENAADWHRVTGYIPITESAVTLLEDEGWFDENPNSKVANDQLAAAPASPATAGALLGNFVNIRDVITEAIEDILVNDLDPASRLEDADAEAQRLLDEYNELFG
ncbi:MAG: extracellular solute-binding protein [Acidimicrobiales bacterium]